MSRAADALNGLQIYTNFIYTVVLVYFNHSFTLQSHILNAYHEEFELRCPKQRVADNTILYCTLFAYTVKNNFVFARICPVTIWSDVY